MGFEKKKKIEKDFEIIHLKINGCVNYISLQTVKLCLIFFVRYKTFLLFLIFY